EYFLFFLSGGLCPVCSYLLYPVSGHVVWVYIVDQNAVFTEFVGQAFHQPNHCGTDSIGKDKIRNRLFHRDRGDGDEAAPLVALHVRDHLVREINRAQEIELCSSAPFFEGGGQEAFGGWTTGIGDTDINSTETLCHFGNEGSHRFRIGDIQRLGEGLHFMLLGNLCSRGVDAGLRARAHRQLAAFRSQSLGGGFSQP